MSWLNKGRVAQASDRPSDTFGVPCGAVPGWQRKVFKQTTVGELEAQSWKLEALQNFMLCSCWVWFRTVAMLWA